MESLASQLQRQKISAEGASGYSKFKSDFQNVQNEESSSPVPQKSEFQQKRRQQFASKKALFEGGSDDFAQQKNERQSLPGAGAVQNARNSLFNQNRGVATPVTLSDQSRPSSAEKYRRDIRLQAVDEADFPDPPPPAVHRVEPRIEPRAEPRFEPRAEPRVEPRYSRRQISVEEDLEDEQEVQANHIYSEPTPPIRSVSEHRFKETKPVEQSARSNSCPDEDELYSEVTVCMSQVGY